jgi:aspartyl-tRNA(Asn)/glutamyl-tRNA(Gln) amidotransferase subunit A
VTPPPFASLHELSAALERGECTAVDLASGYIRRIEALAALHAFIEIDRDSVLRQAEASDLRRRAGHGLGRLDGLPVAVKDLCEIAGQVTSNGSASHTAVVSTRTATVVERLRAAGMVILGKTHMVEFAYGGWGTNALMGTPRNPWDSTCHRIPGGSSSGSAVAVAAGLAPAAIGSDTGGSIRIPAALCGITGLKTTDGLISLYGVLPLSPTCDSIGPLTRNAVDAAMMTMALAGPDPRDSRTWKCPIVEHYGDFGDQADLRGLRIAVLREADFPVAVEAGVLEVFREAQHVLRSLGAALFEESFPIDWAELIARNGQVIGAEAWSTHRARIQDEKLPIGPGVRRRILAASQIEAADYIDAMHHRRRAMSTWKESMAGLDAMLLPTLPLTACPVDSVDETVSVISMFTRAANHVGACAIALPAGFSSAGMPIGVQLIAKPFDEKTLFRIGFSFQAVTDWHRRAPALPPIAGP